MNSTLMCPHTENCPVYEYFTMQADERLNIIEPDSDSYHCVALTYLKGTVSEGDIEIEPGLKARLPKSREDRNCVELDDFECAQIEMLNNTRGTE